MHARAIELYSLVTQQPLGGKAIWWSKTRGNGSLGFKKRMEAANILQEMLTVKSDDINGRTKTYEAIIKGQPMPEADAPDHLKY